MTMMPRTWAALASILLALSPGVSAAQEGSVIRVVPKSKRPPARKPPAQPPDGPKGPKAKIPPLPEPVPAPRAELRVPVEASQPKKKEPDLVPWVGLGASVALGVVGVVFATEAASVLNQDFELEVEGNRAELTDEFEDAQGQLITNTIVSTALISAAAAGIVVSLIFLFEDQS